MPQPMHGIILGSKNPPNGAGRKIAIIAIKSTMLSQDAFK